MNDNVVDRMYGSLIVVCSLDKKNLDNAVEEKNKQKMKIHI